MRTKISRTGKPLTEEAIARAEGTLGRAIPGPYRQFLLEHNGGFPESSDFEMSGWEEGETDSSAVRMFLGIDMEEETFGLPYVLETFGDRIPARMFPIAWDPGGNLILMVASGSEAGKIYFWDHEREAGEGKPPTEQNLQFIAASFDAFLDKLGQA